MPFKTMKAFLTPARHALRRLQALGLRPEDVFTAEMLAEAMEESSAAFELALEQQQAAGGMPA
jgi:hypothetical protein